MAGSERSTPIKISLPFSIDRILQFMQWDIAACLGCCLGLVLLIAPGRLAPGFYFALSPLRFLLAAVLVLFVPGYLLQVLVFPCRADLDGQERLGLSLGLSIGVISVLALVIDRSPWKIGVATIMAGQVGITLLLSILIVLRRRSIPGRQACVPAFPENLREKWAQIGPADRRRIAVLTCGILLAAVFLGINFLESASTRFMTEFYIFGSSGLAEDYPREVAAGEPAVLSVGIHNLENSSAVYSIMVETDYRQKMAYQEITLLQGQQWQGEVEFIMDRPGDNQLVELFLGRESYPFPYRALRIWVDVQPAK
jgi:uncharacterized membrane protein